MWQFHNPVAIHAGAGVLARLPELLGPRRALLVAFPEAEGLGLVQRLRGLLGERLLAVETQVRPNPDVAWLAPLYERLWARHPQAEVVVALGGGSSIDCAKALLTATPSGRFDELLDHLHAGPAGPAAPASVSLSPAATGRPHRALIAIPTTAGTGSEVTPWATLWDAAQGRKHSLHLPWTWPEAALVDPELMLSLPRAATLASGLDALSHALESLWNRQRNPVSSALAISAVRGVMDTLPALLDLLDPPQRQQAATRAEALALRGRMAVAALQAGLAFSNTRTALAHSLSYGITLARGVPHGLACSFSLPRVMALALGHDAALDRELLTLFGARDAAGAIAALDGFLRRLGVSTDPADYGIPPADWDRQVAQALDGPRGRNFISAANSSSSSGSSISQPHPAP